MIESTLRQTGRAWLFILVVASSISCVATRFSSEPLQRDAPAPSITVEHLRAQIDSDSTVLVLDVRTPEEYYGPLWHIEGALLIPIQEIEDRMEELSEYHNEEIYVICRSGGRSSIVTRMLLETGHKATNVEGGMEAWNRMNDDMKGQVN